MNTRLQLLSLILAHGAVLPVSAASCNLPPVVNAGHAVCLEQAFVEGDRPQQWETVYEPLNSESQWLVRYRPKSSGVRGGAGLLEISKSTGEVSMARGER